MSNRQVSMQLPPSSRDEADALKDWRHRKYQGLFDLGDEEIREAIETAVRDMRAASARLRRERPGLFL